VKLSAWIASSMSRRRRLAFTCATADCSHPVSFRACPSCSRAPVSAAARSALARAPSASGDTLWGAGKRTLMIFRCPPVLVRGRRIADTLRAVADAGLRPSRAPAPAVAARKRRGAGGICPPWAPGPAVADLVQACARADGTPRASGFGARPAPGDGGAARDTSPAAIRIRGRHLLCLISIATDISLHECWLPAGLTLRHGIGIGGLRARSGIRREGLDHWSSESGRRRPHETARLRGECPRIGRRMGRL
jgi:hypothetical protein